MKNSDTKDTKDTNKKNAIILSIIALATLVVVVVGATFAYLSSSLMNENSSDINAKTDAGDTLFLIDAGKEMQIVADADNFKKGTNQNLVDYSKSKVILQTTSENTKSINYSIYAEIDFNDFEYTSGKCYNLGTTTGEDETTCSGLWGKASVSDTGACYENTLTQISSYDNQSYCNLAGGVWVKETNPELVIDFYSNIGSKTPTECTSGGVCVNSTTREIINSITDFDTCSKSSGTWMPNISDDSSATSATVCYKLAASKDITEMRPVSITQPTNVKLLDQTISVKGGKTTNYYYATISFVYFDHDQIVNGKKEFTGKILYQQEGN